MVRYWCLEGQIRSQVGQRLPAPNSTRRRAAEVELLRPGWYRRPGLAGHKQEIYSCSRYGVSVILGIVLGGRRWRQWCSHVKSVCGNGAASGVAAHLGISEQRFVSQFVDRGNGNEKAVAGIESERLR